MTRRDAIAFQGQRHFLPANQAISDGGKKPKPHYRICGVLFVNTDDQGNITSINVKHSMFPGVEMVAFPKRNDDADG